jgi:GNAT superfamily N-acetyltransferase
LGIAAVEVAEDQRRRGLARAIMAALIAWGRDNGAVRGYVQVAADNEPAMELYRRLGYWQHHSYHYRQQP